MRQRDLCDPYIYIYIRQHVCPSRGIEARATPLVAHFSDSLAFELSCEATSTVCLIAMRIMVAASSHESAPHAKEAVYGCESRFLALVKRCEEANRKKKRNRIIALS